jgi:hypothetical protein
MLCCWQLRSVKTYNPPMTQPSSTPADRLASALAAAQKDLRTATSLTDEHGRQQYARSARNSAGEVIVDPSATDQQRSAARACMAQAKTMTGEVPPSSPRLRTRARATNISRDRSAGVEID